MSDLLAAFDGRIHPCLTALLGPPPDVDGNNAVIVLVTRLAGTSYGFWRLNQLTNEEAQRYGFHSNEAELLYTQMGFAGNRWATNLVSLARGYAELLAYARDPAETAWSRALATYAPFVCGLDGPRALWGEQAPPVSDTAPHPSAFPGLNLLALEYLRQRAGEPALASLAASSAQGPAALDEVVRVRGVAGSGADLLADAAMAAWLGDQHLAGGRFSIRPLFPPRRGEVTIDVSRASAGSVTVPVGLPTYLRLVRSGDFAQPFTLHGQREVNWVGRAVHLRPYGPDAELALSFLAENIAHMDLSQLRPGEEVVVAALPLPTSSPTFDRRQVQLLWGVGWVPRFPGAAASADLRRLLEARFPDGGANAIASLSAIMARLTGQRPLAGGGKVSTRYSWAPEAARVVDFLRAEAAERQLPARRLSFMRVTPTLVTQEWSNVIIELPGSDPRRWPVVVAAHWDAGRAHIDDAYAHALGAHDNASGVAVALEAAGAMARTPHRAPIIVAFLAGGRHGAAGAQALLEELQGRVSAWIELDGVGFPDAFPNHATITVDGEPRLPLFNAAIQRALREQGLGVRAANGLSDSHTGVAGARRRGVPAVVLNTVHLPPTAAESDLPAEIDLAITSPELMVLLARAVASLAVGLAGSNIP